MGTTAEPADDSSFEPAPRVLIGYAAGAFAFLVGVLLVSDTGGRVLLGIGAVVLAAQAARGWVQRPTLQVTDTGLRMAQGLGHEDVPWEQLGPVTAAESRRLVPTQWLEIDVRVDGMERLVTMPGWRLGVPPAEVADAIEAARPTPT